MVEIKEYTYKEVLDDSFFFRNNESELVSYLREGFKLKTLQSNPSSTPDKSPEVVLAIVDGFLAGATVFMQTRLLLKDVGVQGALSGAGIETLKEYRKYEIGADLMFYPFMHTNYEHIIYSGISPNALKMYKAMGFCILSTPYYLQPRTSKVILGLVGLNRCFSYILDPIIKIFIKMSRILLVKGVRQFEIKEFETVPEWVDTIVYNDIHMFAELHDRKWLQWTLDNNFYHKEHDKQSFWGVFKENKPVGFFCVNERQKDLKGGKIKDAVIGNVYEWGTFNESELSEKDIFKLAQGVFSKNVDMISYSSINRPLMKWIRKFLFYPYSEAHIVYKNTKKKCKEASSIENWRIRLGYGDTPFYF